MGVKKKEKVNIRNNDEKRGRRRLSLFLGKGCVLYIYISCECFFDDDIYIYICDEEALRYGGGTAAVQNSTTYDLPGCRMDQ